MHRRWMEVLHTTLNLVNSWLEYGRGLFHYLLTSEGHPRDLACPDSDPTTWRERHPTPSAPGAASDFSSSGLDLFHLLIKCYGAKMRQPLTRFHGTQCLTVFCVDGLDRLFSCEPLVSALPKLEDSDEQIRRILVAFRGACYAIAAVIQQMNSQTPDWQALRQAVAAFHKHASTLADHSLPALLRYSWKIYDHCIAWHLVPQMEQLAEMGLTLAQMATLRLEHNNRFAKARYDRLPGGGIERPDMAHKPAVQCLKNIYAMNSMGRTLEYKQFQSAFQQAQKQTA